ncbi:MAG: SDR family oxidoreductase [Cypionkella sp.]
MADDAYLRSLFGLEGKVALVTGGSAGLGLVLADALARAGADVLICSRRSDACIASADEINASVGHTAVRGFAGDVGSEEGVSAIAEQVTSLTDRLDILVNNAGATWGASFEDFPWGGWDRVMAVNLYGGFALTQAMMPMLLDAGTPDDPSRIINIGSVMGTVPFADDAFSYMTSKAAIHHLTQMLARRFVRRNLTVNALAPGLFETKMTAFATAADPDGGHPSVPMTRLGRPADLAAALLHLCGPGGAYVTGAVVPVDGGMAVDPPHRMYQPD